jgi:hypothetical protein
MALSEKIIILGIQVDDISTNSGQCTPEVERAVTRCVNRSLGK